MTNDAATDAALAAEIAQEAGALLLDLQRAGACAGHGLGDEADQRANTLILDRLRAARPNDSILSEESADIGDRLTAARVWVIDPLDGTRGYCEGSSEWAIHIALAVNGAPAHGAVALPTLTTIFRSDQPGPLPAARTDKPRILVSATRMPAEAPALAEALGGSLFRMGSAGFKAMAVLRGEADIYYHSGGQHEWDNCAPAAVALAHGLHCSRIDGTPHIYNKADTLMPDLLVCHPDWAAPMLGAIARLGISQS